MSILQRDLQADEELTAILNRAFDTIGFTEKSASEKRGSAKRKAIKDTVWGMLDFSAYEMRLIDSPLMQRMRGIHQLGFSYLTYPSADHKRFIHSLGMAHVVSNFIAGIDRDRSEDGIALKQGKLRFERFEALKPLHKRELLYAALLHDVGHMPFSHASEAPLTNNDALFNCGGVSVGDRLTMIRLEVGKQISLSEAMSIIILLSERFERFYKVVDPHLSEDSLSLPRIACLIAGVTTVEACPNIQEIISAAAVDADKIDYVNRDAKACGISVGVDVSRIFLGGGLVSAPISTFDESYPGDDKTNLFVVNSSGADTLDEIVQARSSLYQRVYLHPLTRTAEALFARALLRNVEMEESRDERLSDALSLWATSDQELLGQLRSSSDAEIASIGLDISLRRMPKKACAFAGGLVDTLVRLRSQISGISPENEAAIRKDIGNSFLEVLTKERIAELGPTYLEDEIKTEALLLADCLKKKKGGKLLPAADLQSVVVTWIAIMGSTRPDAMVFQNGDIVRTPSLTNVQGQLDAYDIFKAVGYVLCDPEWRQIVFQAARVVILRESMKFNSDPVQHRLGKAATPVDFQRHTLLDFESSARRSNLNFLEADALAVAAERAGYYDTMPLLARRHRSIEPHAQKVAEKYATFDGEGGWRIRSETVAAFVDQFPPNLRVPMLLALEGGTCLNQAETARLLARCVEKVSERHPGGMTLVPLTSSSGGASIAVLKPLLKPQVQIASSLTDALKSEDRPIVLVDDNAASGIQSSSQLFSFSGMPPDTWPAELQAEKDLAAPLEPDLFAQLKHRLVGMVTAIGTNIAAKRLDETARTLGLEMFGGLHFAETIGSGILLAPDLAEFLKSVGRDLMAWKLYGKKYDDASAAERVACDANCLGFGNHAGISVTSVNVPASTITALWQPGRFDGQPWIPLFLRRGRFKELLLA